MKRLWILFLLVIMLSGCDTVLQDCKENENVAGVCIDATKPVFSGTDNIEISLHETIDLLEGVTAIDDMDGDLTNDIIVESNLDVSEYGTYLVKYSVSDSKGNETISLRYITVVREIGDIVSILDNGDFSNGLAGFGYYMIDNEGDANLSIEDEKLVIEILNTDPSIWYAPRIQYENLLYETGKTYYVQFEIYSDQNKEFQVQVGELLTSDPWFTQFDGNGAHRFTSTTEPQIFSFSFTMSHSTNTNGCIIFEFGGFGFQESNTTVYLDNIIIQEIE